MMENDGYTPKPERENAEDRLSQFSRACLGITSKPDPDSVLQEIIDSARSLTGARYGALIAFDDSGGMEDLMTSGITPEERRRLGNLPQGLGILGYLDEIDGPLRLADIASHLRSVGFPGNHPPMKTFLGCPIRYQSERLGNIYLTEKEGGREFSREDEEILVMFASQAALVIANARRHREERRVRADLEALLNISPVGVLVCDAKTGDLLSFNEETKRIVGRLNPPGYSLSQLFEVMTLRYADGRQIPMDELPTIKAVRTGETVIADEVVIHLLDGRAINTLVNARPIRREDGEVVSVVSTIQDITPLEEIKRQRTEFLGRVSHEMRTPLASIKGSVATMLSSPHPLDAAETRQFLRIIDEQADNMRYAINGLVDMTQIESGTLSIALEPADLENLVEQARESFLRQGAGNRIELDLAPDLPRVMADGRRIVQVLSNFLKEASEHSLESSAIRISASPEELYVAVSVEAQGKGLPADHPPQPCNGLSQADGEDADKRNGRGLGLAICKGIVEAHGGRMSADGGGLGRVARYDFTIPAVDEIAYGSENAFALENVQSGAPGREQARILVVDADPEARRHIRNSLAEAGFTPVVTGNPDDMERLMEAEKPHLILAEPVLPWGDGFELMERIRKVSDAPVIFVSGHGSGQSIERAFDLGAADYVAKPFTLTELVARIRAALRRSQAPLRTESPEPFVLGDLTIDYAKRLVTVAGRWADLTPTEYKLLTELSTEAGRVLTHEQLLRSVWGPLYATDTRIVRTFIKQVRRKLGDDARQPKYIFAVPRVGYRMARPERVYTPQQGLVAVSSPSLEREGC